MRPIIIALAMALGLSTVSVNYSQAHFLLFQPHKHEVKKKPVVEKPVVKKKTVKKKKYTQKKKYTKKKYVPKKTKKQLYEYRCNVYKKKGKLRKYKRWKRYCDRLARLNKKKVVAKNTIPSGFFDSFFNNSPYSSDTNSAASFFAADRALMANLSSVKRGVVVKSVKKKRPSKSWFKKDPVAIARRYEGMNARRNRRILKTVLNVDPVRIPWCAAFANAMLARAGYEGTGSLMARSFLRYGTRTRSPQEGDIVVFSRGRRGGHVGFYMGEEYRNGRKYILVLGGNQRKAVNVAYYPARRVLGYRKIG